MKILEFALGKANAFLWGVPMLCAFLVTGIYFTLGSKFFPVRRFGFWMKETLLRAIRDREVHQSKAPGTISQWQALTAALAACIGTGNVVGVASAILLGGPGAVFWMWICACFGMMTCCAENILGVKYRISTAHGWLGGAMVYLERGLGFRRLGQVFALLLTLCAFGIGNMTQGNSIALSLQESAHVPPLVTGLCLGVVTGLVILGGVNRIAKVTQRVVPIMSLLFMGASLWVIIINRQNIPHAFGLIFKSAFAPASVLGGVTGYSFQKAVRYGVARGVFSNEAGLGTSAVIHAAAQVDLPARQGLWGIAEVFLDTIVMCTVTALTILSAGVYTPGSTQNGISLNIAAFATVFGKGGGVILTVCLVLFAFATIIGWSYYGERGAEYLWGDKAILPYRILYSALCVLGCVLQGNVVWELADLTNGLLAIPNLIGLWLLSPVVFQELRRLEK